ncbi:STAS domain-containing protein [Pseudenhygromyxa sp. WMMC2535]|uniref:STAS domain-containing protein n=1 Tax=Pseudenhygromyxa sp. WMMC2535 TaxID=2712867 RepID=UPI001552A131|nr:STAS domain-containing protein [Pseudenhygromyxa sp. WMMC2535]NVB42501.1 STAS domain-containing protein [Pseudenhygromyxa sp. WMMC2535]
MQLIDFASCEAGLQQSPLPSWVLDVQTLLICWANAPALELWQASGPEELYARDVTSEATESEIERAALLMQQIAAGKRISQEWTFFQMGEPILLLLDLCGVALPSGGYGLLNQAMPIHDAAPPLVQRKLAMAQQSAFIRVLVGREGALLSKNAEVDKAIGETDSWLDWFEDRAEAEALLAATLAGKTTRVLTRVRAQAGQRWHSIVAQRIQDPVTKEHCVLVEHADETSRIEAEQLAEARSQRIDSLSATLELVERQRQEILTLSAPILDVGDRTLAVPIIGTFDDDQANSLTSRLLEAVVSRRARRVILDVTGVAMVDGRSPERVRQLLGALRLLGAKAMISGIRPQLAKELIHSGLDLGEITILRSLADGLHQTR